MIWLFNLEDLLETLIGIVWQIVAIKKPRSGRSFVYGYMLFVCVSQLSTCERNVGLEHNSCVLVCTGATKAQQARMDLETRGSIHRGRHSVLQRCKMTMNEHIQQVSQYSQVLQFVQKLFCSDYNIASACFNMYEKNKEV